MRYLVEMSDYTRGILVGLLLANIIDIFFEVLT